MITTYFCNLVAGMVFHAAESSNLPEKYYLGLSQSMPNPDGSGCSYPSGGGYMRMEISRLSDLSLPDNGIVCNLSSITFPESTDNWGVFPYFTIHDAQNGGNLLMWGKFRYPRMIEAGVTLTIPAGELKLFVFDSEG